jgi:hypothetical protein
MSPTQKNLKKIEALESQLQVNRVMLPVAAASLLTRETRFCKGLFAF